MRGKSFIRIIGLFIPVFFVFVFNNSIANADDDGQSNDINQQLQASENSNQTLADLNQYQPSNNDNLGNWNASYGSQIRSDASLGENSGVTTVDDFDDGLSLNHATYNGLSEEKDWEKKIDPMGAYYAPLINKYLNSGYTITLNDANLENDNDDFENYVNTKKLSPDYYNYLNFEDDKFFPLDNVRFDLPTAVENAPIFNDEGTKLIAVYNQVYGSGNDYDYTDRFKFNSIIIRNSFGKTTDVFGNTKDGNDPNYNSHSLQDYAGIYQAPIYMVTFKNIDEAMTCFDNDGNKVNISIGIPLDELLFIHVRVYDPNGNLVTNDIKKLFPTDVSNNITTNSNNISASSNNYQKKIDIISDGKIISTVDITNPSSGNFTLKESDLHLPKGYKLAPGMSLKFDSQNQSADYSVEVEKDDSQSTSSDSHTGFFEGVVNAAKNFISNPVQATIDLVKNTANQFVSFAKDLYKKSKDTLSYGIQSLINTFFNSTHNFNIKLLSRGAFKALSGAASMINNISNFKSNMIKGIVHGGISAAIKQSFNDFKSAIVSKIKTLTSFNLHSLVDKINAVKNTPKKFIGNVKAMSRHFSNSVNSAKEVMKNEMDYVNSVIGSVGDNPYIVGKLNAIKSGLGSQMAYFNKYQSQATIKTYSEAKKAYSRYQKVNEIINNVSNTVNGIKAALNPQTSQVAKWLKQYSDNGMAFGFTRKKNLLTMVTPWGDFKFNYHYKKLEQTLYNKFIITKEVIQTIVHTGFEAAGNLLESAADDMISAFPEGLIGTVLIYGLVEGFRDFGLQDKVEKGITDSVYGSIGNQEYTDKQIADHLNPLALINF